MFGSEKEMGREVRNFNTNMFGSGGDGRDFIINLQFYPYNKNMFHTKIIVHCCVY
jgi:hypothetical protein